MVHVSVSDNCKNNENPRTPLCEKEWVLWVRFGAQFNVSRSPYGKNTFSRGTASSHSTTKKSFYLLLSWEGDIANAGHTNISPVKDMCYVCLKIEVSRK